jgi:F-type H+-transporting ATPase subunit a
VEHIEVDPVVLTHLPDNIPVFGGMPVTVTLVTGLMTAAILIIAAIIIRLTVLRKLKEFPHGVQNALELMIDGLASFSKSKVGEKTGNSLAPYMFTLAAFIGFSGVIELFSFGKLRPSPSDINQTAAFALITFVLIRVVAYKRVGVIGRIKHYTNPIFLVAPIKLFVDMAIPVSLSCRMFGNLLGGYVVMELLYSTVFTMWGIPVVGAAFFSLFHYGMQAFIFMTLSLAFIEEAIE